MIRLNFIEVIVFYEVPQIFIATDIFDTKYLCLLYPHDDELCYKYLAVRISEKRLNLFKGQIIDLLSIYQDPEDGCYFDVVVKDANDIIATPLPANQIQPFMLPDDGFYCNYDAIDNEELISRSLQSGKIMSCIAFSDIENSHNIDVNVLTNALDRYQAMVRNCHIKRFGKQYASEANMRACALQAASFDVHFILNETFISCFTTMGGAGCTIGLLFAMLLASKRSDHRTIAKLSLAPGLFNINETMTFGLPIVLNPIFMIPFILTPVITATFAYFMTVIGFCGKMIYAVPWTTPPLLIAWLGSGGSIGAVITQALCVVLSFIVYLPFVFAANKQEN